MVWQALRQICRVEVEPVGQATFRPMEVCEVSRWDPYTFHPCRQLSLSAPSSPLVEAVLRRGGSPPIRAMISVDEPPQDRDHCKTSPESPQFKIMAWLSSGVQIPRIHHNSILNPQNSILGILGTENRHVSLGNRVASASPGKNVQWTPKDAAGDIRRSLNSIQWRCPKCQRQSFY